MKVRAKNETIQKQEKHPIGGGFRSDGTAEWPDDTYTFRRLQDGDITAADAGAPPALNEPAPTPPVESVAPPPLPLPTAPPVPPELKKSKTSKEA